MASPKTSTTEAHRELMGLLVHKELVLEIILSGVARSLYPVSVAKSVLDSIERREAELASILAADSNSN